MSKGTPVFVACDGIRLKLTCTPELLSKPFAECLVTPFLGAFNKKRNTSFEAASLAKVEVNGSVISDLSLSGTAVLDASVKTDEAPSVVLHLPKGGAGTAEACVAAVAAVLALDPKIATSEEASDALRLLRDALKATPTAAEPALTPRVVGAVADFALLTAAAAERPWSAASAEATAALNNLLAASREKAGAFLCAPEVGAIARIVAIFEASTETPLPRLKLLSPILFHLSLLPAISAHAEPLGAAARHALVSVCDSLCVAGLIDETTGASLAEDLIRSSFNLIRVSPPTSVAVDDLVSAVRTLLRSPAEPGTERATALDEAKRTALQLLMVLPEERGFGALHAEWRSVLDLLPPLLYAAEVAVSEEVSNTTVLPLMTLQKFVEADSETRDALKAYLFDEVASAVETGDPYQPKGTIGWDPNVKLGPTGSLRLHLIKLLTSVSHTAKHVCGNMLFAVCADDPHEFAHLCGLGSAAGLLSERGLFAQFQQAMGVS